MSRQRLIHDASWAAATALLDRVREFVPEKQHQLAHRLFYEVVKSSIEALDVSQAREDARLFRRPREN
jgi:hypothetical protein